MLVSIALTAATVCTARAWTKRLDETQWPETRPTGLRLRHIAPRPRRWSFVRNETETRR